MAKTTKHKPNPMAPVKTYRYKWEILLTALLALSMPGKGQTKTICGYCPVPAGWVVTTYGSAPDALGVPPRTILKIDSLPSGSTVEVCGPGPSPFGWVTLSIGDSCARIGGTTHYRRTIKNILGMPTGTVMSICGFDPSPPGWAQVSVDDAWTIIGKMMLKSRTIKKL